MESIVLQIGNKSLFNDIPPHEPSLQASSSPIPRIRIWSTDRNFSV